MKRLALFIFLILVLLELSSHLFGFGFNAYTKPLLMPGLLLVFWTHYKKGIDKVSSGMTIGLLLSCCGDVLLMGQSNQLFFAAGLSSFLLTHLVYVYVFRLSTNDFQWRKVKCGTIPIYLIAGAVLLTFILPGSGALMIPVVIYTLVILSMAFMSFARFGSTHRSSAITVAMGALFFVLSDSMIGLHKFFKPIPYASFLIMLTYLRGQYLIVKGIVDHHNLDNLDFDATPSGSTFRE